MLQDPKEAGFRSPLLSKTTDRPEARQAVLSPLMTLQDTKRRAHSDNRGHPVPAPGQRRKSLVRGPGRDELRNTFAAGCE